MKLDSFKIKNLSETKAEIYIYGDIVDNGWKWVETDVTPEDIKTQLDALKGKELTVYINSAGGDVFAGMAIHNMLKRHDGKVTGHVDGVAASIASAILMACDEIEVPENAYVMIHRPTMTAHGDMDAMLSAAGLLETIEDGLITTYAEHTTLSREAIADLLAAETWFTGAQLSETFNTNIVVTDAVKVAACATEASYKNCPVQFAAENQNVTKLKEIEIALAIN